MPAPTIFASGLAVPFRAVLKNISTVVFAATFSRLLKNLPEVREFVKDLWYRNSREKTSGELDNIRKRREIDREFPPPARFRSADSFGYSRLRDKSRVVQTPASQRVRGFPHATTRDSGL